MRRQVEWADFVSVAEAQGYAERGVMWVDLAVASDSTSLSPDRVKGRTIILSLDPLQPAGEFWLLFSEPAFCLLADAGFLWMSSMTRAIDWESIRAEYEAGCNQSECSRRHGVSRTAIQKRIEKE